MLMVTAVVLTARPVVGIYLIGFLSLFTDGAVSSWYPFLKNMSARESILYLGNAAILSPLEVVLAITTVAWLLRLLIDRGSGRFVRGALFWPMVVFGGLVLLGVMVGVATGGDRYVALWEFRPLLYVPIIYILVTNLFTSREQYRRLGALMLVALVIHAFLAMILYATLSVAERKELESLVGHASAVQMGVVLFGAIAVWVLPRTPWSLRVLVPLAALADRLGLPDLPAAGRDRGPGCRHPAAGHPPQPAEPEVAPQGRAVRHRPDRSATSARSGTARAWPASRPRRSRR